MKPKRNSNQQINPIPAKTKVPLGSRKILKAKSRVAPMKRKVKTPIKMNGVKGAFPGICRMDWCVWRRALGVIEGT
jgi:hypothetical protein